MSSDQSSEKNCDSIQHIFLNQQNFSFPEQSITYYMAKNVSSPTVYQKLIKCCKYFYRNNQILLLHCLILNGQKWFTCLNFGEKSCEKRNGKRCLFLPPFKQLNSKIAKQKTWITNYFGRSPKYFKLFECEPLVIPSNVTFKVMKFEISNFEVFMPQILLFDSSVKICELKRVAANFPFTKIILNFPVLKNFIFRGFVSSYIPSEAVKELLDIPHFYNLKKFQFSYVSENFDIKMFYESFLKKNKTMDVHLIFAVRISEDYKQKVLGIMDEITESSAKNFDFWPPYFAVFNIDPKKEIDLQIAHSEYS